MKKLYVGNLPFKANEQDLADLFVQAGVSGPSVTLVRDQMSGQLRGFGFVEVASDAEAADTAAVLEAGTAEAIAAVVGATSDKREQRALYRVGQCRCL